MSQPNLQTFRALASTEPATAQGLLESLKKRLLKPHAGQQGIIKSTARFKVVRAGRRWGKTKVAARELIREAIKNPGSVNWWIANRWRNTRRGYKEVLKQLPPELLAKPAPSETSNELTLRLANGATIEFYSGESPDSLAGAGVNYVVVDEAALMKANVWQQLIRPTLMDTGGRAMIISTPRGRNWFYDMWNRGQDDFKGDTESWWFPQSSNPYIPEEETESAREELPDFMFRQEIMAEFLSNAASIFDVTASGVVVPGYQEPYGTVFMGVDLARKEDYTVLTAAREDDAMPVYHDRFSGLSWGAQRDAIQGAHEELKERGADHVVIAVDATGVGDAMVEELENLGLDILPVVFSNKWKLKSVKDLGADLEQGRAHILGEQVKEFESYEYEITDAGNYVFQAASGHDDEVSAKLLEHYAMRHEGAPGVSEVTWSGIEVDDEEEAEVIEEFEPDAPEDMMNRPGVWA